MTSAFSAGESEAIFRATANFNALISEAQRASGALNDMGSAGEDAGGRINRGLNDVKPRSVTDKLDAAGAKMDSVGKKATVGMTLPIVAGFAAATKTAADFDLTITKAGTKAGASAAQMKQMSDEALRLGASTIFSAGDAATALDQLTSLGLNANQAMKALPATMKAAQATGGDLGDTANVVATAMDAFGLSANQASHIADVLASGANNSALSMEDMAYAMENAGQLGASANQSLEEVTATLEVLSNKGLKANVAGVAVRQMVQNLQTPHSAKAAKIMKDLGIATRDANGEMLPLHQLITNVSKAVDPASKRFRQFAKDQGLSTRAAKDFALSKVFTVQALTGVNLLLAKGKPFEIDRMKDAAKFTQLQKGLNQVLGPEQAKAFLAAHMQGDKFVATGHDVQTALAGMNKASDGVSSGMAKTFGKTLAAQIDNMKGSFTTLAIVLVRTVVPPLTKLLKLFTSLAEWLAKFSKKHPLVTEVVLGMLAIGAALGPVMLIMSKFVKAASLVIKGGRAISRVIAGRSGGVTGGAGGGAAGGALGRAEPQEVFAARPLPVEVVNAAALGEANATAGRQQALAGQAEPQEIVAVRPLPVEILNTPLPVEVLNASAVGAATAASTAEELQSQAEQVIPGKETPQEVVAVRPLPVEVVNVAALGAATGEATAVGSAEGTTASHAAPQEVFAVRPLPVEVMNAAAIGATSGEASAASHGVPQEIFAVRPLPVEVLNIAALGAVTRAGAVVPVGAAGAGAAGAGAGAVGAGEAAVVGAGAASAARGGLLGRLGMAGKGAFGRLGAVAIPAMALYYGAGMLPGADKPGSPGNIGSAALKGAATGLVAGSVVPVIGPVAGALIGATVTAAWSFMRSHDMPGDSGGVVQGLDDRGKQKVTSGVYAKTIRESGLPRGAAVQQVTTAALGATDLIAAAQKSGVSQDQLTSAISGTSDQYERVIDLMRVSGQLSTENLLKLGQMRTEYQNGAAAARTYADAHGVALQGDLQEMSGAKLLKGAVGGEATAHLSAADAATQYRQSLHLLNDSVAAHGKTLNVDTAAGRANYQALRDAAAASLVHAQAVERRTGSYQKAASALRQDKSLLIDSAQAMGLSREAARKLIDKLYQIPKDRHTNIVLNKRAADQGIDDLQSRLAAIQRRKIYVDVIIRQANQYQAPGTTFGSAASAEHAQAVVNEANRIKAGRSRGGEIAALAGGGELRGRGGPHSDSILAGRNRLSTKEYVVNAEQYAKHRAVLQDINAGRPAEAFRALAHTLGARAGQLMGQQLVVQAPAPQVNVHPPVEKSVVFSPTIYNPQPETSEDTMSRAYAKLAYLGLDAGVS